MTYGPEIHIARAARMATNGHEAEAKAFLRRLALSCLRHSRSLSRGPYADNIGNRLDAVRNREEGAAYARASRQYRGGCVAPSDVALPFWHQVKNAHWPDLGSHVVYAVVHEYKGSKRLAYCVEIQILPGDLARTQACQNKRIDDLAAAELYARKWVTIGMAAIAAEPQAERPTKRRRKTVTNQLQLRGVR